MEEVIPSRLYTKETLEQFLSWLRNLRLDPEDKKQLLMTRCDSWGIPITADLIKRAGIK